MGLLEAFIRRRVMTTVLVLIAVLMGAIAYATLNLRRFPAVEFPTAMVITPFPGGSPAEIERDITKPIEDAVSTIPGIEKVTSTSQRGSSTVTIEFALEEDIDIKSMDIRDRLDQVKGILPEEAEDPFIFKFSFTQMPIIILALSGPQHINELYRVADEDLKAIISQVPGVADVNLTGGQEREIQVLLDARKLRKYRVPITAVALALRTANVDVPAGHITQAGKEYVIRATGRFERVDQIRDVRVPTGGGSILTVGDLGEVVDTYAEPRTRSRFQGRETILLEVQSQTDANEVEVADGVRALMPELAGLLPGDATLEVARDDSVFVRGALDNVKSNMGIGILLTAVVLYLFLSSWRATVIAAVVIPAAVIVSCLGLMVSGFTLNMMSLTGMALVIGVLVNNSILIVENVHRFRDQGLEPFSAAVAGTKDIALAIFSSTATNLVVFLPLAFMGEMIGEFFKELGLTVVYATTASLVASLTLTPMMCAFLMRGDGKAEGLVARARDLTFGMVSKLWQKVFERGRGVYLDLLGWCLEWRWAALLGTALVVAAALGVMRYVISFEFMPSGDEGQFRIVVQMPVGTPLHVTDQVIRRIEGMVETAPCLEEYLEKYDTKVGSVSVPVGGVYSGVNVGEVSVTVVDSAERPVSVDELMNELRPMLADIPSARISVEKGQAWQAPVALEITGDDLEDLQRTALQVMAIVAGVPGTAGVNKSWQAGQPEIRITPRRDAVNRYLTTQLLIGNEVRAYVEGREATEFSDRDETYDVRVKLREVDRDWAQDVGAMFISSPASGQMIPIAQVAEVREGTGPTVITRKDRQRLITVTSSLTYERPLGDVLADVQKRIDSDLVLPRGVRITYGGEAEFMQKNFRELFKAMAIAAVLTFLCVAGIIESFAFAFVICMALPICLIGVALAMLIGGITLNLFSLMAFVILIGMVVNNAIIVIDYAMRHEAPGRSAVDVIKEACGVRYRMILMANLTTVVALIPLSLGRGFGGHVFQPLAVVQMGGVLAAAFLSLLVIPLFYVMLRGRKAEAMMNDES